MHQRRVEIMRAVASEPAILPARTNPSQAMNDVEFGKNSQSSSPIGGKWHGPDADRHQRSGSSAACASNVSSSDAGRLIARATPQNVTREPQGDRGLYRDTRTMKSASRICTVSYKASPALARRQIWKLARARWSAADRVRTVRANPRLLKQTLSRIVRHTRQRRIEGNRIDKLAPHKVARQGLLHVPEVPVRSVFDLTWLETLGPATLALGLGRP